jgi:hypothetical protein
MRRSTAVLAVIAAGSLLWTVGCSDGGGGSSEADTSADEGGSDDAGSDPEGDGDPGESSGSESEPEGEGKPGDEGEASDEGAGSDTSGGEAGEEDTSDPGDDGDGGSGSEVIDDDDEPGEEGGGPEPEPNTVLLIDRQPTKLNNALSSPVSFDVPANTVSVTVIVEGESDELYTLGRWVDASGEALAPPGWFASGDPSLCLTCANRLASAEGVFAAIAPNAPTAKVTAGTHVLTAYGYKLEGSLFQQKLVPSNASVLLSVYAKVLPQAPAAGTLDVNVYLTGANGWTAANAESEPEIQAILASVNEIYAPVGIELGRVTWQDIDPSFKVIESVQGPDNDLMELFAQSEGQDNNALNVFFVEELNVGGPFGGFGVLLGVAGGIPGPALLQGTVKSGVAVAVKPVPEVPAGVDTTMAHEMGHFLGLFHTSEQNFGGFVPSIHDPLPDTPENDETYLMFNTGQGSKLSVWQGRVMRSSLWVRHEEVEP